MRARTLSAALAAAIAIPAAAHADTRVGLGAAASAEAQGLSADLDLGPVLLEATAAVTTMRDAQLPDWSYATATIGALARLAHRDRASLYAGLRVDLTRMRPADPPEVITTEPMLGIPLRLQLDVTPWLSIDAETAIVVIRAGGVRGGQTVTPSIGFTVWF